MAWQRPTRGAPGLVMGPCIVEIDRIVIRDVQCQLEKNQFRNEEVNFQGSKARTDGQTAEITTISPRFSKSVGIITNVIHMERRSRECASCKHRSDCCGSKLARKDG
ncbi:hypothetical protein DPMN_042194 [Dreissena polymorpha]|uniref:Uncharacterized protein n=1 Tax=Dreissena polymorpha TaxID=45954 RepID=A0A9D4D015_DREPO|nr:hypothetical protein DPMN_042194 [Dreissena polymorpha]